MCSFCSPAALVWAVVLTDTSRLQQTHVLVPQLNHVLVPDDVSPLFWKVFLCLEQFWTLVWNASSALINGRILSWSFNIHTWELLSSHVSCRPRRFNEDPVAIKSWLQVSLLIYIIKKSKQKILFYSKINKIYFVHTCMSLQTNFISVKAKS